MKVKTIYVGIDPAFRKDGFAIAIIDYEDRTIRFKKFKNGLVDFMWWMLHERPEKAVFGIENSNEQKALFDRSGSKAVVIQKALSVGKNQAISQNTVDICKVFYPNKTVSISPAEKGAKWVDERIFLGIMKQEGLKLLDYTGGKGAQDERDAAKIALLARRLIKQRAFLNKK